MLASISSNNASEYLVKYFSDSILIDHSTINLSQPTLSRRATDLQLSPYMYLLPHMCLCIYPVI